MERRAFVVSAAGFAAAALGAPVPAASEDLRISIGEADWKVYAATLRELRFMHLWRPASSFPKHSPLALFKPRGSDSLHPDVPVLWINVDHRELLTPRTSHPDDEDPAIAQTLIGAATMTLQSTTWRKLIVTFAAAGPVDSAMIALKIAPLVREAFGSHHRRRT